MQWKTLALSLVLGLSSTAAIAAPSAPAPYAQAGFRDHKRMPPRYESWTTLTSGMLSRGTLQTRVAAGARFDKLKLESTGRSSVFIDKVIVTFGNGRTQVIEVDKWVTGRDAALLDLPGRGDRRIAAISVHGRGSWRSSIKVLGA